MKTKKSRASALIAALGSSKFFWATVLGLILQAAWIAASGRYPMAFDEDFHLGIIRLYAHHILPFWGGQPAGANAYGAVARDPSYLYQYLMSFAYRLINAFTHDQTIQVLWLRAISIGLFAWGLVLFRRLLGKSGASRALINSCFAVFVLIPIVPLLAAQINYDNLLLPVVALSLLLTLRLSDELRRYKRINGRVLVELLIVCLLGSLVKYAFLPIFAAIVIFLIIELWRTYHNWRKFWLSLGFGLTAMTRRTRWLLIIGLLLAGGLFSERYVVNLARYHTPIPSCNKVLGVAQCSAYGPWIRDYNYSVANIHGPRSPLTFTADWFYGMWLRTFFAVDGPGTGFQTRGPLVVPGIGALIFAAVSLLLIIRYGRRLLSRHHTALLWLLLLTAAAYLLALWVDEYQEFLRTGQPVAINGRYMLPVLLPLLLLTALAWRELLQRRSQLKLAVVGAALVCLLWGGGALTYILRSNDAWYWPNQTVLDMNHSVQKVGGPLTPGDDHPTEFMH